VAAIFAREVSPDLTSLVKKVDAESKAKGIKSFVIFLNDDEKLADQLKDLAAKENIKTTVLAIDNVAGPKGYDIAKDADVTVMLYTNRDVKVNHAYKKGELNAKAADEIVTEMATIAPAKKKKKAD